MKRRFKFNSGRHVPILIAGAVIGLVCLLQALPRFHSQFDLLQRLEWISYDWRVRIAGKSLPPCAPNLAGVFIDETALKAMNDGSYGHRVSWPWPRHLYGRLVRELSAQRAKVIAFDILFDQLRPSDPPAKSHPEDPVATPSDEFFAQELRHAGNVVLPAESGNDLFPAELFRTNAWGIGNISSRTDSDGVLRRVKAFTEHRVWHHEIRSRVRALSLALQRAVFEKDRIVLPRTDGEAPFEMPVDAEGRLRMDEITGDKTARPEPANTVQRIWHLGVVLAARELGLNLTNAVVEPGRITLSGESGAQRIIPVDEDGFFYIDWTLTWDDPRFLSENIVKLIRMDEWRQETRIDLPSGFQGKLVVVGSIGTGNNISDRGTTPLEEGTMLVSKHWNVANSILKDRFIRKSSYFEELLLIISMGVVSALLTWKLRALRASFWVVMAVVVYTSLGVFLFVQYRYWLPLFLPVAGALLMTHVCMVTYRAIVEREERQRIKSVFSRIVSPNIVNELLSAETISVGGARRKVTVYFADIRGFTRVTDENQAAAEEYVRTHKLPPAVAEAYLDEQARDVLTTVNMYLSVIADTIKKHNGTLDKYIGDCVMAFWGAPTASDRHALDCVLAAIDAQSAIYELNLLRSVTNRRRERENETRQATGQPSLPLLTLLALGSGINTGMVTVGLMGSDTHIQNYTVFGREVNLASRLEGVSGRGRIILSDSTFQEIKRLDQGLAARCVELPPVTVKGIRDAVRIYEVQWREMDTELQAYDTAILTGRRKTLPTDLIPPISG